MKTSGRNSCLTTRLKKRNILLETYIYGKFSKYWLAAGEFDEMDTACVEGEAPLWLHVCEITSKEQVRLHGHLVTSADRAGER